MRVLITGVTETHINYAQRASSTKFVSIPELMSKGFSQLDCDVDHRRVMPNEDLRAYDRVFVYLYPIGDGNAVNVEGVLWVLRRRPDAYICLDDWSFQRIVDTWASHISVDDLNFHRWIAPLFPWGDIKKLQLPFDYLLRWDPTSLYEPPISHHVAWHKRKSEWYNASLSTEAHHWASAQQLKWPIYSIGGKSLGQQRKLETTVVWEYGSYKGVLCPTYTHAGSGWWRVRYIHAIQAACMLGGSPEEFGAMGPAYGHTLLELEAMPDDQQQQIVIDQTAAFASTCDNLKTTLQTLKAFLT